MTPDEQSIESVPVELRADGLLWAINRTLLHPRGFALAVETETGALTLLGDGSETWQYGAPVDEDAHFADFEALLQRARERHIPSGSTEATS